MRMMLMRKETRAAIITIEFGDFYSMVRKEQKSKRTGKVNLTTASLSAYAQSSTGYRHQLELQGFEVIGH